MLDSLFLPMLPHPSSLLFLWRSRDGNEQSVCHDMLYVYVLSCAASLLYLSPFFLDRVKRYKVKQANPIRTSGTTTEATPTGLFISMAAPLGIACTGHTEDAHVNLSMSMMSMMLSVFEELQSSWSKYTLLSQSVSLFHVNITCAVWQTITPQPRGGAKQCLSAIQGESTCTCKKTLRAKAETPQRVGAVHREGQRQGRDGLTLYRWKQHKL